MCVLCCFFVRVFLQLQKHHLLYACPKRQDRHNTFLYAPSESQQFSSAFCNEDPCPFKSVSSCAPSARPGLVGVVLLSCLLRVHPSKLKLTRTFTVLMGAHIVHDGLILEGMQSQFLCVNCNTPHWNQITFSLDSGLTYHLRTSEASKFQEI